MSLVPQPKYLFRGLEGASQPRGRGAGGRARKLERGGRLTPPRNEEGASEGGREREGMWAGRRAPREHRRGQALRVHFLPAVTLPHIPLRPRSAPRLLRPRRRRVRAACGPPPATYAARVRRRGHLVVGRETPRWCEISPHPHTHPRCGYLGGAAYVLETRNCRVGDSDRLETRNSACWRHGTLA